MFADYLVAFFPMSLLTNHREMDLFSPTPAFAREVFRL